MLQSQPPEVWTDEDEKEYQEALLIQKKAWESAKERQSDIELLILPLMPTLLRSVGCLILGDLVLDHLTQRRNIMKGNDNVPSPTQT